MSLQSPQLLRITKHVHKFLFFPGIHAIFGSLLRLCRYESRTGRHRLLGPLARRSRRPQTHARRAVGGVAPPRPRVATGAASHGPTVASALWAARRTFRSEPAAALRGAA